MEMKFKLKMDNDIYEIIEIDKKSNTVVLYSETRPIRIPIYFITNPDTFKALKLEFIPILDKVG
jgi:hypothetical protein